MLHTPTAQEPGITTERLVTKDGQPAKIGERAYDKDTGRLAQVGLSQQVQMLLPTPMAVEVHHKDRVQRAIDQGQTTFRGRPDEGKDTHPSGLMDYLQFYGMLQDPMKEQIQEMGMLPTPVGTDWQGCYNEKSMAMHEGRDKLLRTLPTILGVYRPTTEGGKHSRLSPLFTEEMMGFPLMWTALPFLSESGAPKPSKPTATPSSPK